MTNEEKKEKQKERFRKWYQANKEKHKEQMKQYYLDHAEELKEHFKQYYNEHADERREYGKQYRQTKEGRAINLTHNYNRIDKAKGFDTSNNVTAEWITANIFSGQSCAYCGETDWEKLGVDRIDNDKPHTPDNVVCCCGKCNVERNRRYTLEEFKDKKAER